MSYLQVDVLDVTQIMYISSQGQMLSAPRHWKKSVTSNTQ